MNIALRMFATAREAAGRASDTFTCAEDATLADVLAAATERYNPDFAHVLANARVWLNGDEPPAGGASVLHEGDEVAVLPPVSGG